MSQSLRATKRDHDNLLPPVVLMASSALDFSNPISKSTSRSEDVIFAGGIYRLVMEFI